MGSFGIEGRGAEADITGLRTPIDFAPLPEGSAAVLEDLDGVVRIAHGGSRVTLSGPSSPRALAVDESGLLLILEGTSGVAGYRKGKEAWRVRFSGDAKLQRPVGMAARNGIIWLVERNPARVLLYAYDGKSLGTTDLKPWVRSAFSVALGPAGEGYVTDPLGPAVVALSAAGTYQSTLSLAGTGVTRPSGLAVDAAGRVWVSDGVTGTLACLAPKGDALSVRIDGKRPRFQDPIRLGWTRGTLWILEAKPGRIRRVQWEEP
jgi:streptogramin lyase